MQYKTYSAAPGQDDPVFESRNHAYGAYDLRKTYEKRLMLGLLGTLGFFLFALMGFSLLNPPSSVPQIDPIGGIFKGNEGVKPEQPPLIIPDRQVHANPDHPHTPPVVITKPVDPAANSHPGNTGKLGDFGNVHQPGGLGGGIGTGTGRGNLHPTLLPLIKRTPKFKKFYDVPPGFPGGHEAYEAFVQSQMHLPETLDGSVPEGEIYLSLSIDEAGNVVDAEVIKGISVRADEEALRVARMMPPWKPALLEGRPVAVKCVTVIHVLQQ